jgi:hypothetical protein
MYVLLPADPHVGFVTLAVIFVSATLLGFASHSPGGIGVFDAAMLVALWEFDREELIAGLLLFRLFYYIIPFALALIVLGTREIVASVLAPDVPHVSEIAHDVLNETDEETHKTGDAKPRRRAMPMSQGDGGA